MHGVTLLLSSAPLVLANPLMWELRARAAEPFAGEATSDIFPPTQTSADPGDGPFPSATVIGYAGPTPTGAESFLIQGAPSFPKLNSYYPLVRPESADTGLNSSFDVALSWGNLSPWQSNDPSVFGLPDASEEIPSECTITQVHLAHRHGARYPTSGSGPSTFAAKVANATKEGKFEATGSLEFLNAWEYKLGSEILTPFGRKQLFELGMSFRQKYGQLLNNFTQTERLPVFRTTSEDRMVKSALNFAAGFFGIPYEDQYHQEIIVEDTGFNNTLAPYDTCNNSNIDPYYSLPDGPFDNWTSTYLQGALERIQPHIQGIKLDINDIYEMQETCPYETVALGYSPFCKVFTQAEWEGFDYSIDLGFWYGSFLGNPTTAAQGVGWVQELLARLTQTEVPSANSTTNSTLDDSTSTFPLDQSIYVDATHDTVLTTYLNALNFTNFAKSGPLPWTHIPEERSFVTRYVSPFAANLVGQVLQCPSSIYYKGRSEGEPEKFMRFILNDAVLPMTGLNGCNENEQGLCPLGTVISGLKDRIETINFDYDCFANYSSSVGYNITTGRPAGQPA